MNARRRRKRKRKIQLVFRISLFLIVLIVGGITLFRAWEWSPFQKTYVEHTGDEYDAFQSEIDVELLTNNPYSRPGTKTNRIRGIVIHYTANPGTSAMQNRNYFEGLKDSKLTKASSHFIVGLDGEIVQCVPTWEVAYASNDRNLDTVSIETCHMTEDGSYTEATKESLVQLTAWLCKKFDLTEQDVIRHYDVTGKICPKYYVEHPEAWEAFRKEVKALLDE